MLATTNGTLTETEVTFAGSSACCVILASGGYPVKYRSGYPISGLEDAEKTAEIYCAGVRREADGTLVTAGGRVLGVVCTAPTLKRAVEAAYAAADGVSFEGMYRRSDIGAKALSIN
jgi:phosphoribosylamine--glycine ligase